MDTLPDDALPRVAAYFQSLSEPARLRLLNLLRTGERSVGDLAELTGSSAANTSRHLAMMAQHGLVKRESRGNCAFYAIADNTVYALCDLVCGSILTNLQKQDGDRATFAALAAAQSQPAPVKRRK